MFPGLSSCSVAKLHLEPGLSNSKSAWSLLWTMLFLQKKKNLQKRCIHISCSLASYVNASGWVSAIHLLITWMLTECLLARKQLCLVPRRPRTCPHRALQVHAPIEAYLGLDRMPWGQNFLLECKSIGGFWRAALRSSFYLPWEAVTRSFLITSWVLMTCRASSHVLLRMELQTIKPFGCSLDSGPQQRGIP